MTGPPTPPPITATEIQDAARTSAPAPAALVVEEEEIMQVEETTSEAPVTSQAGRTAYELLFPMIADLATTNAFHNLIEVAERADMSAAKNDSLERLYVTAPLVLAYLIIDNLPAARFALTRLPDKLAAQPLCQGLHSLIAADWDRQYAVVYSRAGDIHKLCAEGAISDEALAAVVTRLVAEFVAAFRQKTAQLLSKAYTSIPLSLTQTYLGFPVDQTISYAAAHGWSYDTATQVLTLAPPLVSTLRAGAVLSGPSTLDAFSTVADSITRLEA